MHWIVVKNKGQMGNDYRLGRLSGVRSSQGSYLSGLTQYFSGELIDGVQLGASLTGH